jgi:hypothetical protein
MAVVDLKVPRRARRGLPLEQATDASRFYHRVVRDIVADLGGRRELTRIEGELIGAFAGGATVLRYLNRQVALGEISEVSLSDFATISSTLLRIGAKLGLSRRQFDVSPSLGEYLASLPKEPTTEEAGA